MTEHTTRTNIIGFHGLTQFKWSCYSHLIPISKIGSDIDRLTKNPLSIIPLDSLVEVQKTLIDNGIPCFLTTDRSTSQPENLLLTLFVFWVSESSSLASKLKAFQEIKSGIITSDMLQNSTASDIEINSSLYDSRFDTVLKQFISPPESSYWKLPLLNLRECSELDIFLLAVRNLLSSNLFFKGAIPLGRSFLFPFSYESQTIIQEMDSDLKPFALTVDIWLSSGSLFLKVGQQAHPFKSLASKTSVSTGTTVYLSPQGTSGIFLGYVNQLKKYSEAFFKKLWAQGLGIEANLLDSIWDHNKPLFCYVESAEGSKPLIYPTSRVFIPTVPTCSPEILSTEQNLSIVEIFTSMHSETAIRSSEIETGKPKKKTRAPSRAMKNMTSEPSYNQSVLSINSDEQDIWLETLSQSATFQVTTQTKPVVEDNLSAYNNCGFGSQSFLGPNGTDPTPPADSEFAMDNDFLGVNGDFGLEDFDSFQITDNDFNFFDRTETKPSLAATTPISLPEPAGSHPGSVELIGQASDLKSIAPCTSPEQIEALTQSVDSPLPQDQTKQEVSHSLKLGKDIKIITKSLNPWVPKSFSPAKNLIVNSVFLLNGKFSSLTSETSQRLIKKHPERFRNFSYTATYRPIKRQRIAPPKLPPTLAVTKPVESHPTQPNVPPDSPLESSSESSSDSDDSSDCDSIDANVLLPLSQRALFSPMVTSLWSLDGNRSHLALKPDVSSDLPELTFWKDHLTLQLFMDHVRIGFSELADSEASYFFNLWDSVLDISKYLDRIFKPLKSIDQTQKSDDNSIDLQNGPLTLQSCCKTNTPVRTSAYAMREARLSPIVQLPSTKIQARLSTSRIMELSIDSVPFWKELNLQPISSPHNVSYICIFAKDQYLPHDLSAFMSAYRDSYEGCNLGAFMPLEITRVENGLCAVQLGNKDYESFMRTLATLSGFLGREISRIAKTTGLPRNIFILYASPIAPSDSAALFDLTYCFRQLLSSIEATCNLCVRFQALSCNTIAQFNGHTLPERFFPSLAFKTYSRFESENSSMTANKLISSFRPAFTLSRPSPVQINFRMPQNHEPLFDHGISLHLTYAWGTSCDSLVAVWTDSCGQKMEHTLLPVLKRSFKDYAFLVDKLWNATRRFQACLFSNQPRIVITKLGIMEASELNAWKRFISPIPGSCVLSAGFQPVLHLFPPTEEPSALVLTEVHLPHAKHVFTRAVGVLHADQPQKQRVEVVLLADAFNIASPPLPLIPSFRHVLSQLNDLAALDSVLSTRVPLPMAPITPRSTFPCLPLPWRWVQDTCDHLKCLVSKPSTFINVHQ